MNDDEFPLFARQNRGPSVDRQVRNILYGAISTVTGSDPSVVHADLARGRQALAQRRCRQLFLVCVISVTWALWIALVRRRRDPDRPAADPVG